MLEITSRLTTALAEIADCRFGVGPDQSKITNLESRIMSISARLATALAEIADCRFGVGPDQSRITNLESRIMSTTARLSTALADHYKTEDHLGEGGMADVYLAGDLTRLYC